MTKLPQRSRGVAIVKTIFAVLAVLWLGFFLLVWKHGRWPTPASDRATITKLILHLHVLQLAVETSAGDNEGLYPACVQSQEFQKKYLDVSAAALKDRVPIDMTNPFDQSLSGVERVDRCVDTGEHSPSQIASSDRTPLQKGGMFRYYVTSERDSYAMTVACADGMPVLDSGGQNYELDSDEGEQDDPDANRRHQAARERRHRASCGKTVLTGGRTGANSHRPLA